MLRAILKNNFIKYGEWLKIKHFEYKLFLGNLENMLRTSQILKHTFVLENIKNDC